MKILRRNDRPTSIQNIIDDYEETVGDGLDHSASFIQPFAVKRAQRVRKRRKDSKNVGL